MGCPHSSTPEASCFACARAEYATRAPERWVARVAARLRRRGVDEYQATRAARTMYDAPGDKLRDREQRAMTRRIFPRTLF